MNYRYDPDHPIKLSCAEEVLDASDGRLIMAVFAAAQVGADMQLERCCEWLKKEVGKPTLAEVMRQTMRPRPLSKREQAIKAIDALFADDSRVYLPEVLEAIKAAREALMEGQGDG